MITHIYPVLSSSNLERDLQWWTEKLGFQVVFTDDSLPEAQGISYAVLTRDKVYLHLQWHSGSAEDPMERSAVRMETEGVRELFDEMVLRGALAPEAFREATPWGTREYGLYDPNGNAIFFFEGLTKA
jgi:catechol 2,3-dioxygenase-like lactoylglutathione lyase family enzyme